MGLQCRGSGKYLPHPAPAEGVPVPQEHSGREDQDAEAQRRQIRGCHHRSHEDEVGDDHEGDPDDRHHELEAHRPVEAREERRQHDHEDDSDDRVEQEADESDRASHRNDDSADLLDSTPEDLAEFDVPGAELGERFVAVHDALLGHEVAVGHVSDCLR